MEELSEYPAGFEISSSSVGLGCHQHGRDRNVFAGKKKTFKISDEKIQIALDTGKKVLAPGKKEAFG